MSDFISRQAAIDTLDDEITITGKSNAYVVKDYVQRVKRKIENLPSAEPERKTGHWIITEGKFMHSRKYRCSECAHEFDWMYDPMFPPVFNYCQKCGAHMEDA